MKNLKIKRIFAFTIYNQLKNIPPKDYPTTAEIKSTISVILPALKEHIGVYLEIFKKAEEYQIKIENKEITDEETINEAVNKFNTELREYDKENGSEVVELKLDDEGLKIFKSQFDRDNWGKNWFKNIEEFGEVAEAFTEASKN